MTAVLDSNVLLSGFAGVSIPTSIPGQIVLAWIAGLFVLVISDAIFAEVARNIVKPYFRRRLTIQQIAADLTLLATEAQIAPITVSVSGVATHPEDDLVLATALSAGADYLVTGDIQLQALGSYRGVTILSPSDFLGVLAHP